MKLNRIKQIQLPNGYHINVEMDCDRTVRISSENDYNFSTSENSTVWMGSGDLRYLAKKLKKLADKMEACGS